MTQEEMLLEAAETGMPCFSFYLFLKILLEPASVDRIFYLSHMSVFVEIMNMRNLERVLAREEEVKKKAVVQKAVYEGPTLRFYSRDGNSSIPICLRANTELSSYFFLCFLFLL
jgi:hypothetical protein